MSKTELFLERVVAAARPVFDEIIAVQRTGGEAAGLIPTIFEEPHEQEGAVFGLACALRHAAGRCFVLAVDYPLVTPALLRFLVEHGGVPVWNGRPQPVCAVWEADALARVEERIARGAYDLRGLIEQEMIPESELRARFDGEPLMNVNTPEELVAMVSRGTYG